jgi:signal transduction histidine kinase
LTVLIHFCLFPNVVTEDFSCPFCLMQCASFKVYAVICTTVIAFFIHNLIIWEVVAFSLFSLLEVRRKLQKLFFMEIYWISVFYVLIILFEWQSLCSFFFFYQKKKKRVYVVCVGFYCKDN